MNKQVEEMAQVYEEARYKAQETLGSMNEGAGVWYAKAFYKAGYRKQSEVAREIFAEIENTINSLQEDCEEGRNDTIKYKQFYDGRINALEAMKYYLAEIKKKYEVQEDDQSTVEARIEFLERNL